MIFFERRGVARAGLGAGAMLFALWTGSSFGQIFQDRTSTLLPGGVPGKVAWGDYNNDGWVDLCAGGTVYRNNGGASFSASGYSAGGDAIWGDYDNDGNLDLFSYSKRKLYGNTGSEFTDESSKIPSFGSHVSRGAAWTDLNNDGCLDLYVGGYEIWDPGQTFADVILTYDENNQQFNNTWQETVYRARGVTAADFDRDGDQDIYVSNYRLQPNRLWQNNGSGVMTDGAFALGVAGTNQDGLGAYGHTIGSAWGDMDNDGFLDLFVGNFSHSAYYQDRPQFLRNPGASGGQFQLMKTLDGNDWQESYASPALGDYDNDGDLDLFFTTVYAVGSYGIHNYPRLYRNDGNWNFTNVSDSVGLGQLGPTYQAAWADVDNDGDLDLASDGKIFLNGSQSNGNHWLKVRLEGDGETVNRSALGAQVRVYADGKIMTRQVEGGTGEGNQNDLTLHFGLGSHDGPVDVEIFWPEGTTETLHGVQIDQAFHWSWGSAMPETFIGPGSDWSDDANWQDGSAPAPGEQIVKLYVQNGSSVNHTAAQGITQIAGEDSAFRVGCPDAGDGAVTISGGLLYVNSENEPLLGACGDTTPSHGILLVGEEGAFLTEKSLHVGDGEQGTGYFLISDEGQAVVSDILILGSNGGAGYVGLSGNGLLKVGGLAVEKGLLSFASESHARFEIANKDRLYYEYLVTTGKIGVNGSAVVEPFEDIFWVDRNTLMLAAAFNEGFKGSGSDWNDDANWIDGSSPGSGATLNDVFYVLNNSTVNHTAAQGFTRVTGHFALGRPDAGSGTMNLSGGTLYIESRQEASLGVGDSEAAATGILKISGTGLLLSNADVQLGEGSNSVGIITVAEEGQAAVLGDLTLGGQGAFGFVTLSEKGTLTVENLVLSQGWINFVEKSQASLTVLGRDQDYFESLVAEQWIRIDNAPVHGAFDDFFQVDGDTLSLVRHFLDGDLNGDGFVGGDDLDLLRGFWGQQVTPGDLLSGDPSGDGFVGGDDLDIIRANWGQGVPPATAVPEPSIITILLSGLAVALVALGKARAASFPVS